jgi:thymidylate synthase ThyX
LTVEWQPLSTNLGYDIPDLVEEAGLASDYHAAMERSRDLYDAMIDEFPHQAQYAVSLAYRIRYVMQMNAREAMHLIELRSSPQGHPSYRRVAQEMHRLIRDVAGHHAIADAMIYVDHGDIDLERLEAERAAERARTQRS